ncbi:MAG: YqzL family protein [Candidatus Scatovivens sp.]
MIKNIAWNTFKNTGNIDTYLEFSKFKNIEENLAKENLDGTNQGKRNSYIRK